MKIKVLWWQIPVKWLAAFVLMALAPLAATAAYLAIAPTQVGDRFDPAYFTEDYRQKYSDPRLTVSLLVEAMRSNDQAALAELQGLRETQPVPTNPTMEYQLIMETNNPRYYRANLFDRETYRGYSFNIGLINGRWVVFPSSDTFYYLDSGQWRGVMLPLSIVWWVVEAVLIIILWLRGVGKRWREEPVNNSQQVVKANTQMVEMGER